MIFPGTMLDPHKKSPLPPNNSLPRLWFQLHEAYEAAEAPPATMREVKRKFFYGRFGKIWEYILLDDDDDDDDIHMPSNV